MLEIKVDLMKDLFDKEQVKTLAESRFSSLSHSSTVGILFLLKYIHWNEQFGAGVAALAANMARTTHLSRHLIARDIFKAAVDEFGAGESDIPHALMASRLTKELIGLAELNGVTDAIMNKAISEGKHLSKLAFSSYSTVDNLAFPLGFHLASEMHADIEFTVLEKAIKEGGFAETDWVVVHSNSGGHAEADHAELAKNAVELYMSDKVLTTAELASAITSFRSGFSTFSNQMRKVFS